MSDKPKTRFHIESLPAQYTVPMQDGTSRDYHGFVVNESYTGACLSGSNDGAISVELEIKVKIGQMGELRAKVIWVEELDKDVIKFGVQYLT